MGIQIWGAEAAAAAAVQANLDAHAALTDPHSSAVAATADRLVLRDGAGGGFFVAVSVGAAPCTGGDICGPKLFALDVLSHDGITRTNVISVAVNNVLRLGEGVGGIRPTTTEIHADVSLRTQLAGTTRLAQSGANTLFTGTNEYESDFGVQISHKIGGSDKLVHTGTLSKVTNASYQCDVTTSYFVKILGSNKLNMEATFTQLSGTVIILNGPVQLAAGYQAKVTDVNNAAGLFVVTTAHETIAARTATGVILALLPDGAVGERYEVVDADRLAGTSKITITVAGGKTINGVTSLVLEHDGASVILEIESAGNYAIVASHGLANPMTAGYDEVSAQVTVSATLEDITGLTFDLVLTGPGKIQADMVANCTGAGGAVVGGWAVSINAVDGTEMTRAMSGANDEGSLCSKADSGLLPKGTYTVKGRHRRVSGAVNVNTDTAQLRACVVAA